MFGVQATACSWTKQYVESSVSCQGDAGRQFDLCVTRRRSLSSSTRSVAVQMTSRVHISVTATTNMLPIKKISLRARA